ncbi:hypothetical protein RR48_08595 [Papilio machaon]|uniref:Uncharacterized protein n=1 Tax=Papilio machaon TaxID=76193 RepID=A0A194RIZ4_PAPMA|nr:hypothetical protein RR48_08595 [Papilio machaon]
MSHALEWMENNLCVNMAFQLALSLAAEIFSCMPESPYLETAPDGARRYENPLNGAWTFGVQHLSTDNPRHTTSDISGGPLTNRPERYTANVHAYNFAAVSPLQQYPASMVEITNEAVIEGGAVVGYKSYWKSSQPKVDVPQYQAHTSYSVFRVLASLGMIEKND